MAVNKHFHTSGALAVSSEQNLYRDLVTEAIQIHGHDVYYLDRTLVAEDTVFGEDSLSKFQYSAPIEMYMEDAEGGFAGEREMMTQFGLQNLSEATFVVAKERFQGKTKQVQIETSTDTTGGSILVESGTIDSDYKLEGSVFYILSETDATDSDRPLEGDAIYHPTLGKLFEINFVDHDEPFHQLDNNPVYKLRCRLFEYDSQALDTGVSAIDAIEDALTTQALIYQFTLEQSSAVNEDIRLEWGHSADAGLVIDETDGDNIIGQDDTTSVGESVLLENGSFLLNEEYIIGDMDQDKTAQNELFDELDDTILDFSETNPFGDAGST
ncbi:uncharacterized protein METZ01_LOCUS117948 [marine metagenome]|uniref:Neck protein n=1 Tax=marine metagenome TaxID=408172 RepID=A0A381XK06_9ZZZZ